MNHSPGLTTPTDTDVLSFITDEDEDFWPFENIDPPEEDQTDFPEPDDLLKNPKINRKERERIEALLDEPEVDKAKASEVLDYYFGKSEKQGNQWVKVTAGALAER